MKDKIWYCNLTLFFIAEKKDGSLVTKMQILKSPLCFPFIFSTSHFLAVTTLILINIQMLKSSCHS